MYLAMDVDNFPSPATEINEKLINSFIKTTSSSREEANSFLETHQWNLDAAVLAFTENNVANAAAADSNIFNPSDTQPHPTLAARNQFSNLGISIPVPSHSHSSDYYIPSPSGLLLRPPSQSNPSGDRNHPFSKKRAADNRCQSQRIKRCKLAGNKPTVAEISGGSDSDNYDGGEQSGTMMVQDPDDTAVDDGPLVTLDNPENATFNDVVQRLESPRVLRVRIELIKLQEEDFSESTKPNTLTPFQGVGRTLSGSDSTATEPPVSSDSLTTTPPPSTSLVVDPAAQVTSIQVILADGTRIFSRFNTHHTVRDVRGFIDASRPGGSNDYWLLMGFPPKRLLDFDQTIEKAGISNSVLILKY